MTREKIITSMCYTYRHDYGLRRGGAQPGSKWYQGGISDEEAKAIWDQMAQIFDNDIAPHMVFKDENKTTS
jgi:hypothetical protein